MCQPIGGQLKKKYDSAKFRPFTYTVVLKSDVPKSDAF